MRHSKFHSHHNRHHGHSGLFLGGALIIMGLALLAEKLGSLNGLMGWDFWPLLLIWSGVLSFFKVFNTHRYGSFIAGTIKVFLGGFFMAGVLNYIDIDWELFWPVMFIILGIIIFFGTVAARKRRKVNSSKIYKDGEYSISLFMGGQEDELHNKDFIGANVSCVMAGLKLDMRNVIISGDEAVFNVNLKMGGIELRVPGNVEVVSRLDPVMGAVENKTNYEPGENKQRLILTGNIFMSGIEIKN